MAFLHVTVHHATQSKENTVSCSWIHTQAFYLANKLTTYLSSLSRSKHKHSLGKDNLKGDGRGTVHQAAAWMDQIDLKDNPVGNAAEIDGHVSTRWRQWGWKVNVRGRCLRMCSAEVCTRRECINQEYPPGHCSLRPLWSNFTYFIKQLQFIHFSEIGYIAYNWNGSYHRWLDQMMDVALLIKFIGLAAWEFSLAVYFYDT